MKHFFYNFLTLLVILSGSLMATELKRTLGGYSYDYTSTYEPISKEHDYNENYDDYDPEAFYYSDYNDIDYDEEECPNGRCSYLEKVGIVTANKFEEPPQYVDYVPSYYRRYPYYLGHRYGPFFGNTYDY